MMPMLQGRYTLDPLSLERGFSCSGCYGNFRGGYRAMPCCAGQMIHHSQCPGCFSTARDLEICRLCRRPVAAIALAAVQSETPTAPLFTFAAVFALKAKSRKELRAARADSQSNVSIDVNVLNRRVPPSGSASVVSPSRGEEEHIVIATPTARRFKGFLKRRLPPSSTKYGASDNTDGHAADPEFGDAIRLLPI
ncbi:hypothetical protein HDU99_001696 [Rhizoclosmatium hyalinum]|nr:hypothetical protein HDU99_001696 [Rhizoclosmatium hyalinum]